MARNNYASYFHEDFFESSDSAQNKHTNIDIPVIAKTREVIDLSSKLENTVSSNSEKVTSHSSKKENLLFNRAPNFFETSYHLEKNFLGCATWFSVDAHLEKWFCKLPQSWAEL